MVYDEVNGSATEIHRIFLEDESLLSEHVRNAICAARYGFKSAVTGHFNGQRPLLQNV